MPTTRQIRNFKANFRSATLAILTTAGITDVYLERSLAKLKKTARLEVTLDLGEALNEEVLPTGIHVYDFFAARLRIRVVTARGPLEFAPAHEAADLHEGFVADVLDLFAEEKAPFTAELLPYYTVKTLKPLGTKSDLDLVYGEDYTDVDFFMQFGIRSTAWPAEYLTPAG